MQGDNTTEAIKMRAGGPEPSKARKLTVGVYIQIHASCTSHTEAPELPKEAACQAPLQLCRSSSPVSNC